MTIAVRAPVACPIRKRGDDAVAAAVLTIQHARLRLRRELLIALGAGDKRAATALSTARDTLARIELGLQAAKDEAKP